MCPPETRRVRNGYWGSSPGGDVRKGVRACACYVVVSTCAREGQIQGTHHVVDPDEGLLQCRSKGAGGVSTHAEAAGDALRTMNELEVVEDTATYLGRG